MYLVTLSDIYTLGRSQLEIYLATLNTHKRQTIKLPAGFEPLIPGSGQAQTHSTASMIESLNSYELKPPDSTISFNETEKLFILCEIEWFNLLATDFSSNFSTTCI